MFSSGEGGEGFGKVRGPVFNVYPGALYFHGTAVFLLLARKENFTRPKMLFNISISFDTR